VTPDVPAVVERAARLAAHDHQGVVAYRLHRTSDLHAGPYHRSDDVELAVAFDADRLVKIRVLRDRTNGKDAGAAAKADLERTLAQSTPAEGFAVPFDLRHLTEYRYIGGSEGEVGFTSLRRDDRHGDGTFSVNASGAVVRLTYTPNVLPRYATSANISDDRAQVLPDFWATVREEQRYDGRYGPFHGSGTVVSVEDDFERFADAGAAIAAVEAGRI
jgi:hypothetical protein